jgi:hypothetical protein
MRSTRLAGTATVLNETQRSGRSSCALGSLTGVTPQGRAEGKAANQRLGGRSVQPSASAGKRGMNPGVRTPHAAYVACLAVGRPYHPSTNRSETR